MQVPATERKRVRFGPFEVDLASHELRYDGRKIKLQAMPFHVLAILLEHPGELVTREEFRQRLWPSDTFVDFEHSINTAVKKLREALEDDADEPQYIETLPKLGYRFIAKVEDLPKQAQAATPNENHTAPMAAEWRPRGRARWWMSGLGGILLAGMLVIAVNLSGALEGLQKRWIFWRGYPIPIRSLVVLPLQNLSGDPEQEYFADGLTDALITDLGRVSGIRVISHTSAMAYKKTNKALPQIARELDVDAVVEGTVLRSGDKLRVTVQLVRASPEEHVWAERYERAVGEMIPLERHLAHVVARWHSVDCGLPRVPLTFVRRQNALLA